MTTSTTSGRTRVRASIAALAGFALLVSGCGSDNSSAADGDSESQGDNGSAAEVSPLTGLPAKGDDEPVMVVKVDNTGSARPQVGLDGAGLVVEELVEGGMTRLAAFYHAEYPKRVGPVRSMRDSDVGIVSPVEALLVASGGAPGTKKRLKDAGVDLLTEQSSPGFSRSGARTAPYDLMVDLAKAADSVDSTDAPDPYLAFGENELSNGKRVKSFSVKFSSASTTRWRSAKGGWVRANAPVSRKSDFVADNVLVLSVEIGDAGYLDPGGNPVPETKFVGEGKAKLFSNGKVVSGTWSKEDEDSQLTLETKGGEELAVPPGNTFVELMPRDDGTVRMR